jgi:hypothetical protein
MLSTGCLFISEFRPGSTPLELSGLPEWWQQVANDQLSTKVHQPQNKPAFQILMIIEHFFL